MHWFISGGCNYCKKDFTDLFPAIFKELQENFLMSFPHFREYLSPEPLVVFNKGSNAGDLETKIDHGNS